MGLFCQLPFGLGSLPDKWGPLPKGHVGDGDRGVVLYTENQYVYESVTILDNKTSAIQWVRLLASISTHFIGKNPLMNSRHLHIIVGMLLLLGGISEGCQFKGRNDVSWSQREYDVPEDLTPYLDGLEVIHRIESYSNTRTQVDSLLLFSEWFKNYDEDLALAYALTANRIAERENYRLGKGISSYYVAMLKGRKEFYGEGIEDALVDARIGLRMFPIHKYPFWRARTYSLMGNFHYRGRNIDSALMYQEKALEIVRTPRLSYQDSLILSGEILHEIANLYSHEDIALAHQHFTQTAQIYQLIHHPSALARLEVNQALLAIDEKKYGMADSLLAKSVAYTATTYDRNGYVLGLQGIGYLRMEQYRDSAKEKYFDLAIQAFERCLENQQENRYSTYNYIGNVFQMLARRSKDISNLDTSLVYYKRAMEEAQKEGAILVMKKMVRNISRLCDYKDRVNKGNCEELLGKTTMSFLNDNYESILDTVTYSLESANQRLRVSEQNELIATTRRKRQTILFIGGALFVFGALVSLLLIQQQQKRRLQAKMEALRAQINPHFISNSLNAIESLVNLNQREEASKYLIHFSRLSRRILNGSLENSNSLEGELQTLKHFLALEQLRFRDKLHYEITVSPGLNPPMIEFPAMILQPYVENAIWHGIKPKKGPGLLTISIERVGKHLVCTIEDNGIGRKKSRELKAKSALQHKSVGMKITQERILAAGKIKGAKLEIQDIKDTLGEALGTRVILHLPFKLKKTRKP